MVLFEKINTTENVRLEWQLGQNLICMDLINVQQINNLRIFTKIKNLLILWIWTFYQLEHSLVLNEMHGLPN